jgi:hypothetical protein
MDKHGAREALFGREAPMEIPAAPKVARSRSAELDELVNRVGPWGPVTRR